MARAKRRSTAGRRNAVRIINSGDAQTMTGDILHSLADHGSFSGSIGGGIPAGPVVIWAIRTLGDQSRKDLATAGYDFREGSAYVWRQPGTAPFNFAALREVKYLCDFDLSLSDHQLVREFRVAKPAEDLTDAASAGDLDEVLALLAKGVDVNGKDQRGWVALVSAAGNGHMDIVRALLKQGANVNATDYGGWTALMWASQEGHTEVIQTLLSSGLESTDLTVTCVPPGGLFSLNLQFDAAVDA